MVQNSLRAFIRLKYGLLVFVALFLFQPMQVRAVALGSVEVASHLSEPFYGEVPILLDQTESLANITVEIASPMDYRILEIYRDPGLNLMTVDLERDSRGARVEIRSDNPITMPFFNLVLKVKSSEGSVHFKKYPVFLEMPRAKVSAGKQPVAVARDEVVEGFGDSTMPSSSQAVGTTAIRSQPSVAEPFDDPGTGTTPFQAYDGWSRTDRYGPMVYGDTITTVAKRLRVDDRYSLSQVMVALYEKNKSKFSQDNINLINAGTYLDVPRAAEVETISLSQAESLMAEHNRRWEELKRQPRYAAIAEAQRTRYGKRIRVGETASGAAAAPVGGDESTSGDIALPPTTTSSQLDAEGQIAAIEQITALKAQNNDLQLKLAAAEGRIASIGTKPDEAGLAAAEERIKKLELRLTRMQAELDKARRGESAADGQPGLITYALGGLIVVLLGVIGFLMRRERPHPAAATSSSSSSEWEGASLEPTVPESQSDFATDNYDSAEAMAVAAAEAAGGDQLDILEPTEDLSKITEGLEEPEQGDEVQDRDFPDLSELDTADMEAFEGTLNDRQPDPGADYLAEADVYLRYGMEEEAEHNLRMAIKQQPNNADAHCKLFRLISGRPDREGLEAVIESAKQKLSGDGLAKFESAMNEADDFSDTIEEPAVTAKEQDFDIDATVILDVDDIGPRPLESVQPEEFEDTLSGLQAGDSPEAEVSVDDISQTEIDLPSFDDEDVLEDQGEKPEGEGQERHGLNSELSLSEDEMGSSGEISLDVGHEAQDIDRTVKIDLSSMTDMTALEADLPVDEEPGNEESADEETSAGGSDDIFTNTISATLGELHSGEIKIGTGEKDTGSTEPGIETSDETEAGVSEGQTGDADELSQKIEQDIDEVIDMTDHGLGEADIEKELDTLILELESGPGDDSEDEDVTEVSAARLVIDTGRSLLESNSIEEAEETFNRALEGETRGAALLGLAEIAQRRGDEGKAADLLSQAGEIIEDVDRPEYERVLGQQSS